MTVVPAQAATSGQLVLQGQVAGPSGQPVSGAQVQLYAWPSQSFLDTHVTQPGQQVPMSLVGKAVSTGLGQYHVSISSPGTLQSSASPTGIVNFMAVVDGASTGAGWFFFPLRLSNASGQPVLTSVDGPANAPADPVAANLQTRSTSAPQSCIQTTTFVKDLNHDWASIGSSYQRYTGTYAGFTYDTGQTTTLGVGISSSPGHGFTADGSFSWSAGHSLTMDFRDLYGPAADAYQTTWTPGLWKHVVSGTGCYSVWYTTSPHHWPGSVRDHGVSIPAAGYCSDLAALRAIHMTSSRSSTFTGNLGWSMPEIGFNANAQTGWDSSNTLSYTHPAAGDWHVCGVNGHYTESPGRVVAGVPG
jgi:hypothetical protein